MTARKPPQQYAPSSRGEAQRADVVVYHGTAKVWSPSLDMPGASAYQDVACDHWHRDYESAERCGLALARKLARELNAQHTPSLLATPCQYQTHEQQWFDDEPQYLRWCATHGATDTTLHAVKGHADASTWRCPWEAAVAEHLAGGA